MILVKKKLQIQWRKTRHDWRNSEHQQKWSTASSYIRSRWPPATYLHTWAYIFAFCINYFKFDHSHLQLLMNPVLPMIKFICFNVAEETEKSIFYLLQMRLVDLKNTITSCFTSKMNLLSDGEENFSSTFKVLLIGLSIKWHETD